MFRVAAVYTDEIRHNGGGITFGYKRIPVLSAQELHDDNDGGSKLQQYLSDNCCMLGAGQNVIVIEWKDFNDGDSGGYCRIMAVEGLYWVHYYDLIPVTEEEQQ